MTRRKFIRLWMTPQFRCRWHSPRLTYCLMEVFMTELANWHITGDWFDNCSCAVACPCTFAQAPDNGFCESVLFWHIRQGHYSDINLDGLSFVRSPTKPRSGTRWD